MTILSLGTNQFISCVHGPFFSVCLWVFASKLSLPPLLNSESFVQCKMS